MSRPIASRSPMVDSVDKAISRLIGVPCRIEEDVEPNKAEKLLLLARHLKNLLHPPENPLQRDFYTFLTQECYTRDESRGGQVKIIPSGPGWEFIPELCDAFLECPLVFLAKSRRVLASWIACCFDIWIASGGQDPRWPALMNATENRQVVIASRKLLDAQGSAWFLRNRVKFIVDQLEARNIRERWPEFPEWQFTQTEARATNGGLITAIASGADQIRGLGVSLIHGEECAFWEEAQPSIEAMVPATAPYGKIILITTPQVGSYAQRIYQGTLKKQESLYELNYEEAYYPEPELGDEDEEEKEDW